MLKCLQITILWFCVGTIALGIIPIIYSNHMNNEIKKNIVFEYKNSLCDYNVTYIRNDNNFFTAKLEKGDGFCDYNILKYNFEIDSPKGEFNMVFESNPKIKLFWFCLNKENIIYSICRNFNFESKIKSINFQTNTNNSTYSLKFKNKK